jgi:DNA-binding NarL/FixJ family response regulator
LRDGASPDDLAAYFGTHRPFIDERLSALALRFETSDTAAMVTAWERERQAARLATRPTPGEARILVLLESGSTTDEIAKALGASPRTISVRISALLQKFDVGSRPELISLWRTVRGGGPA